MLLGFLKSILGKPKHPHRPSGASSSADELQSLGEGLLDAGKVEEALSTYKKILDIDPYHLVALNQVALCLCRLKRNSEAGVFFQRAALIDDTFAPALVNFAIQLNDSFRSAEAERYLAMAQKIVPGNPHVDGVMGAVKMLRGQPKEACTYYLRAWLKDFDNREFAHNYVFNIGFSSDTTAENIVAEHHFWAQTIRPHSHDSIEAMTSLSHSPRSVHDKIRIGYLSSDFRKHSVRFFFRPLLEGHDRSRFEIFAYYDMAYEDEQTQAIAARVDHFRRIANVPDGDVIKLIRDDHLDILVELTGHTSLTRIHLLTQRLAPLQLTALGYPPTTGLHSIDYKVVDTVAAPVGTEHLYTERLLRLPTSFWCFNPLEETPDPVPPPALRNGYVTFGCFGNISKISRRVLGCWAKIMRELPDSRLVIKAITFQDDEAKESIRGWLRSADIDLGRVSLVPPDRPELLYAAYADIDIVLDTYPFNGGTTSCFALWMGVPIVTMAGDALISRMGASMLHTLGLHEFVARSDDGYVRAAVDLARDTSRLADIRRSLRERMITSPLGSGEIYAREFEHACERALAAARDAGSSIAPATPPLLEEKELIRRAELVQQFGQFDPALRIVEYCLNHYPASTGALIVKSSILEQTGQLQPARDVLSTALESVASDDELSGVKVNLLRLDLTLRQYGDVEGGAENLLNMPLDALGRLHVDLYRCAAQTWKLPLRTSVFAPAGDLPFISVIVHCDSDDRFAEIEENLARSLSLGRYEVLRTNGEWRMPEYLAAISAARSDLLLFLRSGIRLLTPHFHSRLAAAISRFDVVGHAGASRLSGTRWFDAGFEHTHGAVVQPNAAPVGGLELSIYGSSRTEIQSDLVVLDDTLFAARRAVLEKVSFDPELDGEHGLCELDWFVRAHRAGVRLCAVPMLGVCRLESTIHVGRTWSECCEYFREKHNLPDDCDSSPIAGASVLLPSVEHAMPLLERFYGIGELQQND